MIGREGSEDLDKPVIPGIEKHMKSTIQDSDIQGLTIRSNYLRKLLFICFLFLRACFLPSTLIFFFLPLAILAPKHDEVLFEFICLFNFGIVDLLISEHA